MFNSSNNWKYETAHIFGQKIFRKEVLIRTTSWCGLEIVRTTMWCGLEIVRTTMWCGLEIIRTTVTYLITAFSALLNCWNNSVIDALWDQYIEL